jgi:pimeloyl-ACP methyl ester carboxylesterase
MLSGVALDESIGSYQLFPRAASRLADAGLASVRFDYAGLGDSTVAAPTWQQTAVEPFADQALQLLACVREALAVASYVVVGVCFGGRAGLHLIQGPDCRGLVSMEPPLIDHGRWTVLRRRFGRRRLVVALRRNGVTRRLLLAPARAALRERRRTSLTTEALAALTSSRILYLYSEAGLRRDHYRMEAAKQLRALGRRLPREQLGRHEVRVLPTGPLTGFDLLSGAHQSVILEHVVAWVSACFEDDPRADTRPDPLTREAVAEV